MAKEKTKAAAKKAPAKKTTAKKAVVKKVTEKKSTVKKPVAKKVATKKPATKKAPVKKTTVAKKPVVKKTVTKKATATKKTVAKKASKTNVDFEIQCRPGDAVSLAGSFNDWDTKKKKLKEKGKTGLFQGKISLPAGEYEYKFCVNGDWTIDPENPNFKNNDMGTLNSFLIVE